VTEPGPEATDAELADYYDHHRDLAAWGASEPLEAPARPDITISVRFSSADELITVRNRAEGAGLKPTAYIRRLVLAADEPSSDPSAPGRER
jgi:hypothetical protein